jgi:hypothetical protein
LKKFLVVLLALLYFVAGSDLLLRQHYCGGDFVAAQLDLFSIGEKEMCTSCGMEEEEGGCCENKATILKKAFDQQLSNVLIWLFDGSPIDIVTSFVFSFSPNIRIPELKVLLPLQKPPPKTISIFKEVCCFRI